MTLFIQISYYFFCFLFNSSRPQSCVTAQLFSTKAAQYSSRTSIKNGQQICQNYHDQTLKNVKLTTINVFEQKLQKDFLIIRVYFLLVLRKVETKFQTEDDFSISCSQFVSCHSRIKVYNTYVFVFILQEAKEALTLEVRKLVTSSKLLVRSSSTANAANSPSPDFQTHLTNCLTLLRRLTELSAKMAAHTASPLHTRNLVLKVQDVVAVFTDLLATEGQEALLTKQAENLASVLATLLRSLRVFTPQHVAMPQTVKRGSGTVDVVVLILITSLWRGKPLCQVLKPQFI